MGLSRSKIAHSLPKELEIILKQLSSDNELRTIASFAKRRNIHPVSELEFFATFDLLPVYHNFHPSESPASSPLDIQSAAIHAAEGGSLSALGALLDIVKKELLKGTLEDALCVASSPATRTQYNC